MLLARKNAAILLLLTASAVCGAVRSQRVNAATGPIEAPFAFRAVGVYGSGETVRVRASADGVTWSEWVAVEPEEPGAGGLAYFDEPRHWVEVDRPASLLFIDPGASPVVKGRRFSLSEPRVVTRAEWGCGDCAFRGGTPSYSTVTHLIVHHTAGANTASDWSAVMRSIWALHVNGNGWSDIGYNYLIDPNGVLYEGRQGGDGVIGAHFSGVNTGTAGFSLMGTYSTVAPFSPAMETLVAALAWKARRWNLDPGAALLHPSSQLRLNVISGHRDAGLSLRASSTTECPGNALYVLLPELRRRARSLLELAPPPELQCDPAAPCIKGVLTSGSRTDTPLVAGSWMSIYGANLHGDLEVETRSGSQLARHKPAIAYASEQQINALLPAAINTGMARLILGPAEMLVSVTEAAPSIFVAQNHEDGQINTADAPARAGSPIVLYLTGIRTSTPWSVTIGARAVEGLFLGATPGFAGLFQANVVVPSDTPPGAHEMVLTVSGARAAPVTVHIR